MLTVSQLNVELFKICRELAEARKEAMIERIRSLRAQLSAIETIIGSLQVNGEAHAPPELPVGKWNDDVPF